MSRWTPEREARARMIQAGGVVLGNELQEAIEEIDALRIELAAARETLDEERCEDATEILELRANLASAEDVERQLRVHLDRLVTIVDEAFGTQPVMPWAELLTLLERKLFEQRADLARVTAERDALLQAALKVQHVFSADEVTSGEHYGAMDDLDASIAKVSPP